MRMLCQGCGRQRDVRLVNDQMLCMPCAEALHPAIVEQIECVNVTISVEKTKAIDSDWLKMELIRKLEEVGEMITGSDDGPLFTVEAGPGTIVQITDKGEWRTIDVEPIPRKGGS